MKIKEGLAAAAAQVDALINPSPPDDGQAQSIAKLEMEKAEVKEALKKVEAEIEANKAVIEKLDKHIDQAVASNDREREKWLRQEKDQLREEKNKLRDKENLLIRQLGEVKSPPPTSAPEELTKFWRFLLQTPLPDTSHPASAIHAYSSFLSLPEDIHALILPKAVEPVVYPSQSLIIRKCAREVAELLFRDWEAGSQGAVLSGSPGIGKSHFGNYLLWRLAQKKISVIFYTMTRKSTFFIFRPDGTVGICKEDQVPNVLNKHRSDKWWYIHDTGGVDITPLLLPCYSVTTVSPNERHYHEFYKKVQSRYFLPPWTLEELKAVAKCPVLLEELGAKLLSTSIQRFRNDEFLTERFAVFGGVFRNFFSSTTPETYAENVDDALSTNFSWKHIAKYFDRPGPNQFFSHRVFCINTSPPDYTSRRIGFISDFTRKLTFDKYFQVEAAEICELLASQERSHQGMAFEGLAHSLLEKIKQYGPYEITSLPFHIVFEEEKTQQQQQLTQQAQTQQQGASVPARYGSWGGTPSASSSTPQEEQQQHHTQNTSKSTVVKGSKGAPTKFQCNILGQKYFDSQNFSKGHCPINPDVLYKPLSTTFPAIDSFLCQRQVDAGGGENILVVNAFQMTISEDKRPSLAQLRLFSRRLVANLPSTPSRYSRIDLNFILVVDPTAYQNYCVQSLPCCANQATGGKIEVIQEAGKVKWEENNHHIFFAPYALRIPSELFYKPASSLQ